MSRRGDTEAVAFLVALVVAVTFAVWVRWFAPCDALGWLPVAEIPARCLMR
jgi:hypothetical protein